MRRPLKYGESAVFHRRSATTFQPHYLSAGAPSIFTQHASFARLFKKEGFILSEARLYEGGVLHGQQLIFGGEKLETRVKS